MISGGWKGGRDGQLTVAAMPGRHGPARRSRRDALMSGAPVSARPAALTFMPQREDVAGQHPDQDLIQ
jgi:hypothetical protein